MIERRMAGRMMKGAEAVFGESVRDERCRPVVGERDAAARAGGYSQGKKGEQKKEGVLVNWHRPCAGEGVAERRRTGRRSWHEGETV